MVVSVSWVPLRFRSLVAVAVTTALIAGPACSGKSSSERSIEVAAGRAATLRVPNGPTIRVPKGAVSGSGRLTVRKDGIGEVEGLVAAGPAWLIELDGSRLVDSIRVEIPVSAKPSRDRAFVLGVRTDGGDWKLADARFDAALRAMVVETAHLSRWAPLQWVADRAAGVFKSAWRAVFNDGLFGADQPTCPDEDGARAGGLSVSSDSGDQVKWCLGREPTGRRILKVANNRRYAVAVGVPPGVTLIDRPARSLAIKYLGNAIDERLRRDEGRPAVVVGAGDTVTLGVDVAAGKRVEVFTEPSGLTYLTDILDVAVDLYATVVAALPRQGTKAEAAERIGSRMIASTNCLLGQFDEGGAFGPEAPTDPVTLARGTAQTTFGCLGSIAREVFTGAVGAVIAVVVGIPTGLAVALIGGGEFFRDAFTGRYNYGIALTSAAQVAPVITESGISRLRLGMTLTAAKATGEIGPTSPGCELGGPGPLIAPIKVKGVTGHVFFFEDAIESIEIEDGAKTAAGVGPGSTAAEVQRAYNSGGYVTTRSDSTREVFGFDLVTVERNGTQVFEADVDPATDRVGSVFVSGVQLCD